jgi:hypothetical protein
MKTVAHEEGRLPAMTVAGEIADHQARCLSHLISLQMLAQGEAGVPLPQWAAAEVARAAGAILTETEAASRAALATVRSGHYQDPADGPFLRLLLDRLAAAADDAIAAARAGDPAVMSRHLRKFDALTSAIWTVV